MPHTGAFPLPLRILLAEDEPLIMLMLEDVVTELGFEVLVTAGSFEQALKQAAQADYDAAILDWNLAGKTSLPVAEVAQKRGKALLLVTGYDEKFLPENLRSVPLLRKPFDHSKLACAITQAISKIR